MVCVGSAYCAVGKVERARQQQILQGVESDAVAKQLAYRLAHVDVVVFVDQRDRILVDKQFPHLDSEQRTD